MPFVSFFLPGAFSSSSSLLLSEELSVLALVAALVVALVAALVAAGAGGGTALYAPKQTKLISINNDAFITVQPSQKSGNTPGLDFLVGGASSSDEESSLLDSAAAAGLAGAAGLLTGDFTAA